jgi:Pyruvate/2-oxoacid:ferredoxin oxidoreductase delta subunit
MLHPEINWDACQECSPCLARKSCKTKALLQLDPGDAPYIDYARCTNCAQCVLGCSFSAIAMINTKIPNALKVMRG